MRRSVSVPDDMHSKLRKSTSKLRGSTYAQRECVAKDGAYMSGVCLVKASRGCAKAMEVTLTCTGDRLHVDFAQERNGVVHRFRLCELWLSALAVGWLWGDTDVFAIAAVHEGSLHHAVFLYPTCKHRNEWLWFFETRRLHTAPFVLFERITEQRQSVSLLTPVHE